MGVSSNRSPHVPKTGYKIDGNAVSYKTTKLRVYDVDAPGVASTHVVRSCGINASILAVTETMLSFLR